MVSLIAIDDLVHFCSAHFGECSDELIDGIRVLRVDGLEATIPGGGGDGSQALHDGHQLFRLVGRVVFESRRPQVVVALDCVEDVERQVQ